MQSFLQYRKLKRDAQGEQPSVGIDSIPYTDSETSDISKDEKDENGSWYARTSKNRYFTSAFESQEKRGDNIMVEFADDDPESPRNWPLSTRIGTTLIIFVNVVVLEWGAGVDGSLNSRISEFYHTTALRESNNPALYVFGIAIGALFAGPISETIGRNPVYVCSRFIQLAFAIGCSFAPNVQAQLVLRFFVGLAAGQVAAINGASLADIYDTNGRSIAWPWVASGSFYGTVFGPFASGWISDNYYISWRWAEWIGTILLLVSLLLNFFLLPETFAPILLKWKAEQLRRVTGNTRYRAHIELQDSVPKRYLISFQRMIHMTTREPIVLLLGLWLTIIYAVIFGLLQGFKFIFQDTYGFSQHLSSSCFAAIAVGILISTIISVPLAYRHKRKAYRWDNQNEIPYPPEHRLSPSFGAAILFPISMFWLGWTNYAWISPWSNIGALVVFGYCWATIYVAIYFYILDVYTIYAGSALATISFIRFFVAASMVVASTPMYKDLGVHFVFTWLGAVAAVLALAPFWFYRFGSWLRKKSKFAGHHVSKDDPEDLDNGPGVPKD